MNTSLLADTTIGDLSTRCEAEAPCVFAVPHLGGVLALGNCGDLVRDIIDGLACMNAADVRLDANAIGRLLQARALRHDEQDSSLVLHTHKERLFSGAEVACNLVFDHYADWPVLWWQVSMMNVAVGGGTSMIWSSSQVTRDAMLGLLRNAAGGVSSEFREIAPPVPSNALLHQLIGDH